MEHTLTPPMSIAQVAALFGVRTETVRRWCQAGKIAHSRPPGGDYLIARSVVQQFLPAEAPGQLESDRQRTKRVAAAKAAIKNL